MKIGLISDIHAHLSDLERALDILYSHSVEKILCAGDLVEKGPDGDAVVELLNKNLIAAVEGNHDENAVRHGALGFEDGETRLSAESLSFLTALPKTRDYEWNGKRVLLCHGTPESNKTRVYAEKVPKRMKKYLRQSCYDIFIHGHSHAPMDVNWKGIRLLNPGSVRGVRARDSHTCGVLDLSSGVFDVLRLKDGRPY